jgi:hypothetical protein
MGLFSTHHHHTETKTVPYEKTVTVNEHRAPTDKSVQLLNEFTEKARQNIIDTIHIKNNVIDCYVIYYQDDIVTDSLKYYIRFKLNGVEHKMNGNIDKAELHESSYAYQFRNQGILILVYKKYAELIAEELIKATSKEHQFLTGK